MTPLEDRLTMLRRMVTKEPGESESAKRARIRGRRFERWLRDLLLEAQMTPRTSYRPKGEEIDGSFLFGTRVFLLEAKWTARPVPASAIYAFKGKVDGKLAGTIGVFLSMSDYSD